MIDGFVKSSPNVSRSELPIAHGYMDRLFFNFDTAMSTNAKDSLQKIRFLNLSAQ